MFALMVNGSAMPSAVTPSADIDIINRLLSSADGEISVALRDNVEIINFVHCRKDRFDPHHGNLPFRKLTIGAKKAHTLAIHGKPMGIFPQEGGTW